MEKKWNLETACATINRNGGKISTEKKITIKAPGIKILGAIDFLVNHCGYTWAK